MNKKLKKQATLFDAQQVDVTLQFGPIVSGFIRDEAEKLSRETGMKIKHTPVVRKWLEDGIREWAKRTGTKLAQNWTSYQ